MRQYRVSEDVLGSSEDRWEGRTAKEALSAAFRIKHFPKVGDKALACGYETWHDPRNDVQISDEPHVIEAIYDSQADTARITFSDEVSFVAEPAPPSEQRPAGQTARPRVKSNLF